MNPNSWMDLLFLIVLFLVGLYGVWTGFKNFQLAQRIKNTAVSKAGSVAIGLVEISGRASSDAPGRPDQRDPVRVPGKLPANISPRAMHCTGS